MRRHVQTRRRPARSAERRTRARPEGSRCTNAATRVTLVVWRSKSCPLQRIAISTPPRMTLDDAVSSYLSLTRACACPPSRTRPRRGRLQAETSDQMIVPAWENISERMAYRFQVDTSDAMIVQAWKVSPERMGLRQSLGRSVAQRQSVMMVWVKPLWASWMLL